MKNVPTYRACSICGTTAASARLVSSFAYDAPEEGFGWEKPNKTKKSKGSALLSRQMCMALCMSRDKTASDRRCFDKGHVPSFGSLSHRRGRAKWRGDRYPDRVRYFNFVTLTDTALRAGGSIRLITKITQSVDDNILNLPRKTDPTNPLGSFP